MPNEIKIIKPVSDYPFDSEMFLIEAQKFELTFKTLLKRCDSTDAARFAANVFSRMAKQFETKRLALSRNLE